MTDSPYQTIVRGLLEMHRLTIAGLDESEEADALRDAMEKPWNALTQDESDQVRNLSIELFSISEKKAK